MCVNFEVNGNCANPQIATNGPLYGQDGVRVTAGSTVNIIDTLLSQNLVQGTGAPTRGAAAGNEFLNQAAGLRLIGAGAVADPAQQHRRQLLRRVQRAARRRGGQQRRPDPRR